MRSLQARLLAGLLALVVAVSALVAGLTYRRILDETSELFDYQLRQMALSLRDQASLGRIDWPADANDSDFVIQIWNPFGAKIYRSKPGLPFIDRAVLGYSDLVLKGARWRVYSLQVEYGVIQVAQPWSVREQLAGRAALRSVVPLFLFLPLMALAIVVTVGRGLAPLRRLAEEVQRRDVHTLSAIDTPRLPREVAPLVGELNRLLVRLAEAFHTQRDFVADAAHELRSPLTALRLQVQLLGRAPDDAARREALRHLGEAVDRTIHLAGQLLILARHEPEGAEHNAEHLALDVVVREAAADTDTQSLAQSRATTLEMDLLPGVMAFGDRASLRILIRNLIDNAVRYTPARGEVRVTVSRNGDGESQLLVDDSGPGIPTAERERAIDRFYRRTGSGESGSGLGLSIVKAIAGRHGARFSLETSPAGGLRAALVFPAAPALPVP